MKIWYEIDDALAEAIDDQEAQFHADCRFEVWEWCTLGSCSEASLVGRFPNHRLAESVATSLNDQVKQTGRGAFYPRDMRQAAYDLFHAADLDTSTVH